MNHGLLYNKVETAIVGLIKSRISSAHEKSLMWTKYWICDSWAILIRHWAIEHISNKSGKAILGQLKIKIVEINPRKTVVNPKEIYPISGKRIHRDTTFVDFGEIVNRTMKFELISLKNTFFGWLLKLEVGRRHSFPNEL